MTEIYLNIDARMADYIRTHPCLPCAALLCWLNLVSHCGHTHARFARRGAQLTVVDYDAFEDNP